jgi:Ser-tRNA(Ala) deacylase AlaX
MHLEDFCILRCKANVVELIKEDGRDIVILEKTAFYPQGGGQPYDKGIIKSTSAEFIVEEVRIINGIVKHLGKFENNNFNKNDIVDCIIDKERRLLNSRLHSAGHVVDMAVQQLGINWLPGKGHHFPNGSYVEYSGSLEGLDKEAIKSNLEILCNQFIQEGQQTNVMFTNRENLNSLCHFIPDYVPHDKPIRIVLFGNNFAIPCGGTHVKNISEIKNMVIRKIKLEKGNIRVSYDIAQ